MMALMFVPISFPFAWGYIVLNFAAGYLYGVLTGVLVTSLGALLGAVISFAACRRLGKEWVTAYTSRFQQARALIRVLEGRGGWRIVAMLRLTPIPFGVQNALLSASDIGLQRYATATFCGLLPTQFLNAYMGTTLGALSDVFAGKAPGASSTIIIASQVLFFVLVTWYVNRRMKRELDLMVDKPLLGGAGGPTTSIDASGASDDSGNDDDVAPSSDALPPLCLGGLERRQSTNSSGADQ